MIFVLVNVKRFKLVCNSTLALFSFERGYISLYELNRSHLGATMYVRRGKKRNDMHMILL